MDFERGDLGFNQIRTTETESLNWTLLFASKHAGKGTQNLVSVLKRYRVSASPRAGFLSLGMSILTFGAG